MHFLLPLWGLMVCGCGPSETEPRRFDRAQWLLTDGADHPERAALIQDLMASDTLKKMSRKQLLDFLGAPTRTDGLYVFYEISRERWGFFPLHTRTLVVKFNDAHAVDWIRIHE